MLNPTKKNRDENTVAKPIFDEIVESTERGETPQTRRARRGGEAPPEPGLDGKVGLTSYFQEMEKAEDEELPPQD